MRKQMPKGKNAGDAPAEDHIAEFDARVEKLVKIAEDAKFESGTLLGDIRDTMLEQFKHQPKPWSNMSQIEQRDLGKVFENAARLFVRKTVLIVAEEDLVSVQGTLKGYSGKGGDFKATIEARGDEDTALELFKMDGHAVVIMSADATRFEGQRKDVETQPDQPALGFSDGPTGEQPPADDSDLVDAAEEPPEAEDVANELEAAADEA
jgi:hypothetical protein